MKRQQAADIADWRALSPERFGFLLFLAAALHGVLALALSFELPEPPPRQPTLDITLAQYQQEQAPEQVDFIAQHNQQGSGNSDEKRAPKTTEEAPFSEQKPKPQAAQSTPTPPSAQPEPEPVPATAPAPAAPAPEAAPASQSGQQQVITTTARSNTTASPDTEQQAAARPQPHSGQSSSLLARSLEIASLQAQLDREREQFAKRPRVRRLTAASTMSHEDAVYLDNWRRRIESVGNLNYPERARRERIYGVLRLLVEILPDGSVQQVRILESSGHAILDDAAVRIVQLAAPFQPFPVEMRKRTDRLEIIRTWKFEKQARVY
jgi:protein TonB